MSERNIRCTTSLDGTIPDLVLASARVRTGLFLPCRIDVQWTLKGRAEDRAGAYEKAAKEWLGKPLELTITDLDHAGQEKIYKGTVLSAVMEENGLSVSAESEDHMLNRGRRHRAYCEQEIKDIVTDVVGAAVPTSSLTHPSPSIRFAFFQQYDETDREFLLRLARLDGCLFYHDGETFVYEPSLGAGASVSLPLEDVENLVLECRIGITKWRGVPYEFFNHKEPGDVRKQSGTFTPPENGFAKAAYDAAGNVFGSVTEDLYAEPVRDPEGFEGFLKNAQKGAAGRHVVLEGVVKNPAVTVGRTITCEDHPLLKDPFVVTDCTATFDGNVYTARVEAVPQGTTVFPEERTPQRYRSLLQPAVVTENKDPDALGRVQIKYLWDPDGNALAWARLVQAGAGKGYGTHFVPRIGDQVLIGCEFGDSSLPVVLGALYHSEHAPDFVTDNGTEEVLVVKTPQQSTIRVVDTGGGEEIVVSMKDNKNLIRLELTGPKITVESVDGTVLVHAKTIEIKADEKLLMEAEQIEVTARQNHSTTTGKDLTTTVGGKAKEEVAQDKSITSGTATKIQAGTSVKIAATQVESSAAATNVIKGALVQIN